MAGASAGSKAKMSCFDEQACEAVDAAVFSGDVLLTSLPAFKLYLERWNRTAAEAEAEAEAEEAR